ncbi:MAG: CoA-acylating methylmalonate-semialdehyde dehydrogenase [archaeon]|nr:CoA-acylating methylmalonate-semialdehyde dehydrogenase [archaeon]
MTKYAQNYGRLDLLIDGKWRTSNSTSVQKVFDPGTGKPIGEVPFATLEETNLAVETSQAAFEKWSRKPILERIKYLFKMRLVIEDHFDELATINTQNHGKTLEESRGELQRTIENVESAISTAYTLSKGETLDQIASGVDEYSVKEPMGVFAIVCPFNFPLMVPFWFIPYALVLGDAIVVKPSEIDPIPTSHLIKIIQDEVGLPGGVLNLLHGSKDTVEALISNKLVQGVTFVGSTPVAKRVYELAGKYGKRAIANGGAKNSIVVMADAQIDSVVSPIVSSFFGNAGQRCLAGANLISIGDDTHEKLISKFSKAASELKVGYGLDASSEMGPVISSRAKERVLAYVDKGIAEGAMLATDGRGPNIASHPEGFYLAPTIFDLVNEDMSIAKEEIFGPIASVLSFDSLDNAIESINKNTNFGNMACIFTSSGKDASKFRHEVNAGNIGINLGVAQPASPFPFGGRRESFYGVLHAQIDTVDFFTDKKIVISRW